MLQLSSGQTFSSIKILIASVVPNTLTLFDLGAFTNLYLGSSWDG